MRQLVVMMMQVAMASQVMAQVPNVRGSWKLINSAKQVITIDIRQQARSGIEGIVLIKYNMFINGQQFGRDLIGSVSGTRMYFKVPYLNGYGDYVARLIPPKNVRAKYSETFTTVNQCQSTGSTDHDTGLPILACVFPTAKNSFFNKGEMMKEE